MSQWIKKFLGIQDEGRQRTQTHRRTGHHPAAESNHKGDSAERHPLEEGRDAAVEKNRAVHRTAISRSRSGETGTIHGFTAEHLDNLKALEVFLKIGIELRQFLPHAVVGLAVATLQPEDDQGDRNLGEEQE